MPGILVKNNKYYAYFTAVRGSSFIRLYDMNGYCFRSFLDITPTGFSDFTNYVLVDGNREEGKTYYKYDEVNGNYTITEIDEDYKGGNILEIQELFKLDVAPVAGVGTINAWPVGINNKKLTLSLPAGNYAQSGLIINFKTTVPSCEVSHIIIEDSEYELVDTANVNISNYHSAFVTNSIVSITIDMEDKKAVVNNLKFSSNLKIDTNEPESDDVDLWISLYLINYCCISSEDISSDDDVDLFN